MFNFLRIIGHLLPGNFARTWFYLYCIAKPRSFVRRSLKTFYRIEHVYDVLGEAKRDYGGRFSVLEFGTARGYAFVKLLYATKYMQMADRVTCHAFDSFEGLPPMDAELDQGLIDRQWHEGSFMGNFEELDTYCRERYANYQIHKGYFEETLTESFLNTLREELPLLVWIDCDYYSSTRTVFDRLLPYLPNGCVCYFDDFDWNYGSRLTAEARFVHELNSGEFGNDIELVLDTTLSLDTRRIYRFVRAGAAVFYPLLRPETGRPLPARRLTNDSALP